MRLTLEVISANGDALGSNRSKSIGPEGAQIGRSKESDWVINDPYISRIHARIRFVNGTYYVEGTGRNPLALNDPNNVVPNNQPQLLRTGDRFFLDQYEIRATFESSERKPPPDPFIQESDSPTVRVAPLPPVQPVWQQPEINVQDIRIQNADESGETGLDPLAILNAGRAPAAAPPVRPINLEQGPVVENHFSPPQPLPRGLSPSDPTPAPAIPVNEPTQRIPAEYRPGMTHLGPAAPHAEPTTRKLPPAVPTPAQNPVTERGGGGKGIPQSWLNPSSFTGADPAAAQPPAVATTPLQVGATPPPERHDPRFSPPEQRPEPPRAAPVGRSEPRINPFEPRTNQFERSAPERVNPFERPMPPGFSKTINRASQSIAHSAPPELPAAAPPRETRSASLEQLLAAAGVSESQMAPELAQELGEVLRVVVQGLMEVLQSRAEIKSQLRMNMTLMKPAENNPLKFSPNVEAALHTLLVERNRGYLPTVRAFHEALTDIRHHQIAVLQGIRSAFQAMIEQFNPVRLEQEFERHGAKRGLLNVGAKSRFRDSYVEEFERLTRDPDDSFKRLFGEYFAQAYEDQMEQLKAAARNEAR